jgi:hypothetical protein
MSNRKPLAATAAAAAAVGLAAVCWAAWDYRRWTALGKGGMPHTLGGWWQVTKLRLRKAEARGVGVYAASIGGSTDSVRLHGIPRREGPRPKIGVHPIPHRQLDQLSSPDVRRTQRAMFDAYVDGQGDYLRYAKSGYEKHNDAVFIQEPRIANPLGQTTRGEVAHIHPSDGSMHMIFSPSDAKTVIENGWGERHPLAGVSHGLPDTYLLIYTPRTLQELMVVQKLLKAAISNMCQCDVAIPKFSF